MAHRPRTLLALVVALGVGTAPVAACASTATPTTTRATPAAGPSPSATARPALARLERGHGARLGVLAVDTGSGRTLAYRADERFAFASTGKALTAGLLLRTASDRDLRRVVRYRKADLLEYAPVTRRHLRTGMSLRGLTIAALQLSDNTAANLVMRELGGPAAVERALRRMGDRTTRVDRTEPTLNTAKRGDRRDTTTPRAIAGDLRKLLLGTELVPRRRALLRRWMIGNTTGDAYVRAGVPAGWVVADKTGAGGHGTRNDVAVAWPPQGAPIVIAVLSDRRDPQAASDDDLIARATRTAVRALR
ncbi:class A beta-lactamase [Patulibacter sp. SYSU D01012]|uniref:class A beta-lactamase n=1 Tax=Patulibacter sp. SYSU D01012 TaxID=2817381 RepID=UPI001B30C273|nr:class A beta-lactamase [Patulibacter sp. SYSU D01012]